MVGTRRIPALIWHRDSYRMAIQLIAHASIVYRRSCIYVGPDDVERNKEVTMSRQRNIINIEPSAYSKEESFITGPSTCPKCFGRGEFLPDEIGPGEYKRNPCGYCEGTGKLIAHITITWTPATK